jgi:hypothetical protein
VSARRASPSACSADERQRVVVGRDAAPPEAALRVRERAAEQRLEVGGGERLEHEDPRPRQERRVHLERRVLGGRADQRHRAALDVREEGVLLRAVETVDLVHEENRLPPLHEPPLGLRDDLAHPRHAVGDRREGDEGALRVVGHEARDRGLAGTRRPPEEDRAEHAALDQLA